MLRNDAGEPVSSDAAVLLFGIFLEGERNAEAKAVAEWLIAREPDAVRGYIALAEVTERMGDAPGAEAVLRRDGWLPVAAGDLALELDEVELGQVRSAHSSTPLVICFSTSTAHRHSSSDSRFSRL